MTRSVWKGPHIDLNIIRRFDELLSISLEQYFEQNNLIKPEIMSRKFLKQHSLEILLIAKQLTADEPIEVWSRRSYISSEFLGFHFLVYNGHVYQKIIVNEDMIGKKFGEFAATKRIGTKIHDVKKKKKKK